MTLLVDNQLSKRIATEPPLATEVIAGDFDRIDGKIQAASLDLTIGSIFIPGSEPAKPGGANCPKLYHSLATGQTAIIVTKEELRLAPDLAGIGFPPASVSLKGLLMTNPGHIDPGYRGRLHLTVINMSSAPFSLKSGERIIRVLFIPLTQNPSAPYNARRGISSTQPITPQLLEDLSAPR